jgi:hypothetical protein
MFVVLTRKRDILDLTAEQLRYVPKVILLREFGDYVERVWSKLPEHLQRDVEVSRYRVCREHYNGPSRRTHVDGSPPLIKDCDECSSPPRITWV